LNLRKKYEKKQGKSEIWWSFGSTTNSIGVLTNDMFLGDKSERTMFIISTQTVRDISRYSAISTEKELLLVPGTVLIVDSILCQGELTIVQLTEKIEPALSILPQPSPQPQPNPEVKLEPINVICGRCKTFLYANLDKYYIGPPSQGHLSSELFTNQDPIQTEIYSTDKAATKINCKKNCHKGQWLIDAGTGYINRKGYNYALACGPGFVEYSVKK